MARWNASQIAANLGKRLIKSPRVYLRDSGLLHALLGIETLDALLAHPIAGAAWEGTVIEHLLTHAPEHAQPHFYRTVAGAELDLVIETPAGLRAFEAKFGLHPKLSRGYHHAFGDLGIDCGTVVYSGDENYRMTPDANVASLQEAIREAGRST